MQLEAGFLKRDSHLAPRCPSAAKARYERMHTLKHHRLSVEPLRLRESGVPMCGRPGGDARSLLLLLRRGAVCGSRWVALPRLLAGPALSRFVVRGLSQPEFVPA